MHRYYSDVNNGYYTVRQQTDNIRASGWQSPIPTTNLASSSLAPLLRIVVDCPFGFKKCDYTIDKSQRGRLTVAARRRHTFKSDYLLLKNKNNTALQTFTIPSDADVDRLQSHIERSTNQLIIEIPRSNSSSIYARNTYSNLIRSPDLLINTSPLLHEDKKYTETYLDDKRKLEYRVDCRDYTADELDVFIQGRDLIAQGKTKRSVSSNPTQQHVSKQFSRKIPLPNTVDLSRVVSYFENGELRIEAALKPEMHYNNRRILSSGLVPVAISHRAMGESNRIHSPIPSHHQQHVHVRRHQSSNPVRREHSIESLHNPSYRLSRDFDDNDDDDDRREDRRQRTVNHQPYVSDRHDFHREPIHKSVYSPSDNIVTTTTTYRN